MGEPLDRQRLAELACVGAGTTDPELRALERAMYIEEVLPIVLPDSVLDDRHLGTEASVLAVLRAQPTPRG